jgi:Fur family peroxide stress response transcriptional regulator
VQHTSSSDFRKLCAGHGIAMTHQRQVLFEVMQGMEGIPARKKYMPG